MPVPKGLGGSPKDRGAVVGSVLQTYVSVLKDICDATNNMPYVRVAAGIVLKIIEVKDEIDTYQKRWDEVLRNVVDVVQILRNTHNFCRTFKLKQDIEMPDDLKQIMEAMQKDLEEVVKVMSECRSSNKIQQMKFNILRSDMLDKINECDRRLKDLIQNHSLTTVMNIRMHQYAYEAVSRPPEYAPMSTDAPEMPVSQLLPPQIFFGRDKELEQIVTMILDASPIPARIAIMGLGGMGKTALARAVLTDPRIEEHFRHARYLVPCDASSSVPALLAAIAQTLGILERDSKTSALTLDQRVMSCLTSSSCIICLDNFETPWDQNPRDKKAVEMLLSRITSLRSVTVLITMRGEERPAETAWTQPWLPSLRTFDLDAAKQTWLKITGKQEVDEWAEKLILAVDCLPLAITLLGPLAQVSSTSEQLWQRWGKDQTQLLSSLELSIELSITSSRMQNNPLALSLLKILSFLPDGMHSDQLQQLNEVLPDLPNAMQGMIPLLLSGLAYESADHRFQIQSLIRSYCQRKYPVSKETADALRQHYTGLASKGYDAMGTPFYKEITLELNNLEFILHDSLSPNAPINKQSVIEATLAFTQFRIYIGVFSDSLVNMASNCAKMESNGLYANCLHIWGSVYLADDRIVDAEAKFKSALELHQTVDDLAGQANDFRQLGEVKYRLDQLESAEENYQQAFKLHEKAHNISGQANVLTHLADIYRRQGNLLDAEDAYLKASQLHHDSDDMMGKANDLKGLGHVYQRLDKLKESKESYEGALKLHESVHDLVGQAYDIFGLGDLHYRSDEHEKAAECYKRALEIHKQVNDRLGQANDLSHLGNVYRKLGQYDEAKSHYQQALLLHQKALDRVGQANDLKGLASTYIKLNEKEKASEKYEEALELFKSADNKLGKANCLASLGRIYYDRNLLDKARKNFQESFELHQQANDSIGQGNALNDLGDIQRRFKNYGEAERLYKQALQMHEKANDRVGQGNDYKGLGAVYEKMNQNEKAKRMYELAADMHRQSGRRRSQALDLSLLAKVYHKLGDHEQAKEIQQRSLQLK
ncbi:TPR-like protein [Artomyces pyxidatus]|uniref:TPR-like protein n=1 Tax=Artomyces pyxidatus TaxID=48021 RepID=A0ACB8SYP2_9AGAM|nr:TPR-like protein [Artomyces pyxidatus]